MFWNYIYILEDGVDHIDMSIGEQIRNELLLVVRKSERTSEHSDNGTKIEQT